jgi:hypothetical protein
MLPGFSADASLMKSYNYTVNTLDYTTKIIPQVSGGGPSCLVCGHYSNGCHMSCNSVRKYPTREARLQCHQNCADVWGDCFVDCGGFSVPPPVGGADWKCVWNDSINAYQCV